MVKLRVISRLKMAKRWLRIAGQRGQLSPTNIIGFFVIIVIVASLMGPIIDIIATATNSTDAWTTTLLNLLPLFLVLGVIITLFTYASPHYTQ